MTEFASRKWGTDRCIDDVVADIIAEQDQQSDTAVAEPTVRTHPVRVSAGRSAVEAVQGR